MDAPLDLCQEQQAFRGVFNGGVIGQIFNGMNHGFPLLSCRNLITILPSWQSIHFFANGKG